MKNPNAHLGIINPNGAQESTLFFEKENLTEKLLKKYKPRAICDNKNIKKDNTKKMAA